MNKFYEESIYPTYKNKYIITIFIYKILNLIFIEFNIFSHFKNYFFYFNFNIAIFITKIIIYSRSSSSYKSSKSERKDYL